MALEMAKSNLLNFYFIVGLTEKMEKFIQVLEQLLPSYFQGAFKHFKGLNSKGIFLTKY